LPSRRCWAARSPSTVPAAALRDGVLARAGIATVTGYLASVRAVDVSLRTRASLEERYFELSPSRTRGAVRESVLAQTRAEVRMTLRRGETLLLTIASGALLVSSRWLTSPRHRGASIDSSPRASWRCASCHFAGVALHRHRLRAIFGVLRRLHVTPLGQRRLIGAKIGGQSWSPSCSRSRPDGRGPGAPVAPHGGGVGAADTVAC